MNNLDYIQLAADLAAKIDPHRTKSNPRVGCVVVQNKQVIAQGAHQKFGEAHAEANALKGLTKTDLASATVYVTLEPCVQCAGKKTPACTDLLLQLTPQKVVIGSLDPHFPGTGVTQLKAAGVEVEVLNTQHHQNLNPWFNTWITQKKPFITLKVGQSLDGKITPPLAAYAQGKRAITNQAVQAHVHHLRATHQAVLTSTETILEDNPKLDVRHAPTLSQPTSAPDVIVVGKRVIPKSFNIFTDKNRQVYFLDALTDLQNFCQEKQIASIMTECGGTLNTQFIEADLVNQLEIFTAPIFCGDTAKPSFTKLLDLSPFQLKAKQAYGDNFGLTLAASS